MQTRPYIVGYKSSDEAIVCDNQEVAQVYIQDLIAEGEDPDNIVVYRGQMITANIELQRTAVVRIKG